MQQQNWTVGSRYMIPTNSILKSGSSASNLIDFKNHIKEGGEIIMATSINLDKEAAVINTKLKVDLNNKTIVGGLFTESNGNMNEGNSDSYTFWIKEGGDLTIDGNGEIVAQDATYSMAVWANGGNVTIKGGTFRNGGDGTDLIYASAGGSVYIYGGEFTAASVVEKPNKLETSLEAHCNSASSVDTIHPCCPFDPSSNEMTIPSTPKLL